MEDSKINYNRKEMTEEEIARDENFDLLLKKHGQFQWRKRIGVGGLLLASVFLLVALGFYINNISKPKNVTKKPVIENEKGIKTPFDFDIEYKEFFVQNDKGGVFKYDNSEITIAPNSFVDSNGNLIEGEVKIKYREFHNSIDFFVSGIPMTYDSAGYEYHFESAGMFDIKGFKNETPIVLAKPLKIKMASLQEGDYFNKYYFDQIDNEWKFISKDEVVLNTLVQDSVINQDIVNDILPKIEAKIQEIENSKPVLKSDNSVCIKIEVDSAEFPELNKLQNVLFEIDKKDKNFDPELANTEWDDIKLKKSKTNYQLEFFDKFKKTVINAKPVLDKEEFKKAMDVYLSANKLRMDKLKEERNKIIQASQLFNNQAVVVTDIGDYVYRIFQVNNFGIYNSDCPRRLPKGQMIATVFTNTKKGSKTIDTLNLVNVYLIEENKNALYNLYNYSAISFDPQNKYMLWAVTDKNELAVFTAKKFAKIPKNFSGTYNFEMKLSSKKMSSLRQVKSILDMKSLFNDI